MNLTCHDNQDFLNFTKMDKRKSRFWLKLVVVFMISVLALGTGAYGQRHKIFIWYLEGNKAVQETVILAILVNAAPVLEREVKLNLPEKLVTWMMNTRNEKERQGDALKDVRKFAELAFKNHWLKFKDVHNANTLNGFNLNRLEYALEWNHGGADEVLAAFNVNFLKREVGKMQVNVQCHFFTELRIYIEKRAREN
jgi:hypothetical protein